MQVLLGGSLGATLICPNCGTGIELTITLGPTEPQPGGGSQVEVGFDPEDFDRQFGAHVMADPLAHPDFVDPA